MITRRQMFGNVAAIVVATTLPTSPRPIWEIPPNILRWTPVPVGWGYGVIGRYDVRFYIPKLGFHQYGVDVAKPGWDRIRALEVLQKCVKRTIVASGTDKVKWIPHPWGPLLSERFYNDEMLDEWAV